MTRSRAPLRGWIASFGMGGSVRDVLPGYDCPHKAVFLSVMSITRGSITLERVICTFEHDSARPITRHMGYSEAEFGAVRATLDYILHIDGTIEVCLSASGDWRVASTAMERRSGRPLKITRTFIENENDAMLKFPYNFQAGCSHQPRGEEPTVVGSKRLIENANRARYNFAPSKRKDTGLSSSNNSLDGEIITQHDLVAWVNVGMHHLPQAEDSPVIRTNLAASSPISMQHLRHTVENFDADVSMESMNAILLTPPKNPGEP
ncbi:copper amine oxidase [Rhodofomes roseus]|uniref:Amine oxidase n=1 Tax=Rhodofomes roseus TaxID=34475 RepID=A0ABQ8KRT5_9APHY|nr:copper amine oxidase [Rhodofomes roseus]KAH9840835.1 copper amine oxidase [Rhodofomes roseus]